MIDVRLVPGHLIKDATEELRPWIEKALSYNDGMLDFEDLQWLCVAGRCRMYAAFTESEVLGAIFAELHVYPKKKAINLVVVAGRPGVRQWGHPILARIIEDAQEVGADAVYGLGRPGWLKLAREFGFETRNRTGSVRILT